MTDEELNDDLLAPPGDVAVAAVPTLDDPGEEAGPEWVPAHGFTDAKLAVRIWVDESTRQLQRVHVSPRWRGVLGPNRSLEQAFQEAFFVAAIRVGDDPLADLAPVMPEIQQPEFANREALEERLLVLSERYEELRALPSHEVRGDEYRGEPTDVRRGPVRVILSLQGLIEAVRFDRSWLLDASSQQIEAGVLETARAAYAHYVPPEYHPGEFAVLAEEYRRVHEELLTLMEKGSR